MIGEPGRSSQPAGWWRRRGVGANPANPGLALEEGAEDGEAQGEFREALRGTGVVGGATAVNLLISMVRTKAMAVLVGPEGTGLMALLTSASSVVAAVTSLGVSSSGVREIGEAAASGDGVRVMTAATVVRRAAIFTGVAGVVLQLVLAAPLSRITFGNDAMTASVAAMSITLLFQAITTGRQAILQGTRQLGRYGKQAVFSALAAAFLSVGIVGLFGRRGIAAALVGGAGGSAMVAVWLTRDSGVGSIRLSARRFLEASRRMIGLGVAITLGSVATMATSFAMSALVSRQLGIKGAGLYSAAWSLSGMYVGFILSAMGTDYLPRLMATLTERRRLAVTLNEQVRVALLVGVPGILVTLMLGRPILWLFYSAEYATALVPLRWFMIGLFGRLLSWPMGYLFIAAGSGAWFLGMELAANGLHLSLVALLIRRSGLVGVAQAFVILYVFYTFLVSLAVGARFKITYSRDALATAGLGIVGVASVTALTEGGAGIVRYALAGVVTAMWTTFAARELVKRTGRTAGEWRRSIGAVFRASNG